MSWPQVFEPSEYRRRLARAQALMADHGVAALLLTREPDLRYFTGFLTRFWQSPTRPWFLVVPAQGEPVAVIPSIGAPLMARGWISDIRTWRSPAPQDEGISLLADTLHEIAGKGACIATPMGAETHVRMPLADFHRLERALAAEGSEIVDDFSIMRALRMVKSEAEIAAIRAACAVAGRAFARVPEIARAGVPMERVFRHFQMLCLEEGADWVPYLAGASAPGGYGDVISPATDRPLARGDVLMLDTGLVRAGYFCDFDRNFSVGPVARDVASAHSRLIDAVDAALPLARPGNTAAELFHAMDRVVTGGAGGSDAGRLGHGLGMQLTEWPSLAAHDHTVLQEGMVLTLEPGIEIAPGRMLVHEENIVLRAAGAEFLSPRAPCDMPELEA